MSNYYSEEIEPEVESEAHGYSTTESDYPLNDDYEPTKTTKKFKLCTFFAEGKCTRGSSCTFAHGDAELAISSSGIRPPPSVPGPENPRKRGGERSVMCIHFMKNNCSKGDDCTFSHDAEEFKKSRPAGYKSVLCKNYEMNGKCKMDSICSYAHGRYELRPVSFTGDFEAKIKEMPQWKSTFCTFFMNSGNCKHGEDCPYAHGDSELRMNKQSWGDAHLGPIATLCKFFKEGNCKMGSLCRYSHGPPQGPPQGPPRGPPRGSPSQGRPQGILGLAPNQDYIVKEPRRHGSFSHGVYNEGHGSYMSNRQGGSDIESMVRDFPIPQDTSGVLVNKDALYKEFMGFLETKIQSATSGVNTPEMMFIPLGGNVSNSGQQQQQQLREPMRRRVADVGQQQQQQQNQLLGREPDDAGFGRAPGANRQSGMQVVDYRQPSQQNYSGSGYDEYESATQLHLDSRMQQPQGSSHMSRGDTLSSRPSAGGLYPQHRTIGGGGGGGPSNNF